MNLKIVIFTKFLAVLKSRKMLNNNFIDYNISKITKKECEIHDIITIQIVW